MKRTHKPLQILVYQDVLCAWCFVADKRLEVLREELGSAVSWHARPYPLRTQDCVPSPWETKRWLRDIARARREPEGTRLSPELWSSSDPPRSSIPPLAALEAARLQGHEQRDRLAYALRRAALEQGINVSRSDVVLELASSVGLNMNRFAAAFQAIQARRLIVDEHRLAVGRGVKGVPALVLAGRWLLTGLKELTEYRQHILWCIEKTGLLDSGSAEGLLH